MQDGESIKRRRRSKVGTIEQAHLIHTRRQHKRHVFNHSNNTPKANKRHVFTITQRNNNAELQETTIKSTDYDRHTATLTRFYLTETGATHRHLHKTPK